MKDLIGGIFGLILLAILGYWIFSAIFNKSNDNLFDKNDNKSEDCGYGYHLEGYITPYGETITECFEN